LRRLIDEDLAHLSGPIRQEVLSGIRDHSQFTPLRDMLRPFTDLEIITGDYERAAEMLNICRSQGIQGSNTDFLICAVAERLGLSILTTDRDFQLFQAHITVNLYQIS
jgi:predicted nucleic acid-binding protein